jgi:hypothetical protein
MEVFDRSLTHIPIEMHTKYLSNFHIKYISNSDQFVSSGLGVQNGVPKSEFIIGENCDISVINFVIRVTLLPTSCRCR